LRRTEPPADRRPCSERRELVSRWIGLSEDPRRFLRRVLVGFVAVECALVVLHFLARYLARELEIGSSDGHVGGFDMADEANLTVWFSSFQLLIVSLLCLLADWSRQADDAGSARSWRWGTLVFLFMAIDETSGLHEIFGKAMVRLLPGVPLADRTWWLIPYALGLGAALILMARELAREPKLLLLAACAPACWVVAVGADHISSGTAAVAIEEGLEMLGATLLLAALGEFLIRQVRPTPNGA